jgi:SAM-dependent methyltransferase
MSGCVTKQPDIDFFSICYNFGMEILSFNRKAWDKQVESGNQWTIPVTTEQVDAARRGEWQILLTPTKPVPESWFPPDLHGVDILCLASGGGQQGPILAATGARITVFDNSPNQLARDRMVADRDGLHISTVLGDMADQSCFDNGSFDLIINPVSTCFIPDVKPVWKECFRVLRGGGALLTGFMQPHAYCLDLREGIYQVRFSIPYSDLTSISNEERIQRFGADTPLEFSHTFSDQIGGQLEAGFSMVDMYEDFDPGEAINKFMPTFMATRSVKARS